jgi:SdrD B-like protein
MARFFHTPRAGILGLRFSKFLIMKLQVEGMRRRFILSLAFVCAAAASAQAASGARENSARATADPKARVVSARDAAEGPVQASAPLVFGSIAPISADGSPQQVFTRRSDVFLGAGPLQTPCQFAAFVPDGNYYFQVTDASGARLLSTDPVAERSVVVVSGVIALFSGGTHETGTHLTACGSLPVGLSPFQDAGNRDALYIVWLTPAAAFDGSPSQVDQVCGTGCFHGFHTDASLTAAFRVEDKASCDPSFCASGVAFNDLNGNGVRDSGEPGLDGVPVRVESASGVVLTTVTAPDGSFEICGLTSGEDFRVTSPAPLGFTKTGPINTTIAPRVFGKDFTYVIEVCLGNVPNLTFPNQPLAGVIGGVKFEDANGDGIREPGESPLSGVTILLGTGIGAPLQTTVTAADGTFLFSNVAAGTYLLTESVPVGFTQTVPASGGITVNLPAGGSSLDSVFGNFHGILKGKITGSKFNDSNGNGVRDPGEPPVPGVTFDLQTFVPPPAFGVIVQTVVTDERGEFEFKDVPFGPYNVIEHVPEGSQATVPPNGIIQVTVDLAHRSVEGLLFGNRALTASIAGMKFNDANGNGVLDAGEAGVAGVTIVLTSSTPGQGSPVMTTTDSAGNFSFSNVTPGTYTVSEVLPPGFTQTVPGGGGNIPVTVAAGDAKTGLLFGNQAGGTGSISGLKFLDLDKNGVINGLDRPFPGIVFVLTDAAGNTKTTTSAVDGTFSFTSLAPGTYVLSEILPPNTVQTFPGTPTDPKTYTITLTPGQHATGFLFLNKC